MKTNFFKVDRDIQNHWLWHDKPFSKGQAWIDLILLAVHTPKKDFTRNGKLITKNRGEVHCSMVFLAQRWGWSRDKVRRFIRLLEAEGMCRVNATTDNTTLTIENYSIYQGQYTTDNTTDNTTNNTADKTTDNTQTIKIKKVKNVNNNIYSASKRFLKPTVEDVRAYCTERKNTVDPEQFYDYYEANGWTQGKGKPIKDWKACVRTWEKNEFRKKRSTMDELKEAYQTFERMEVMK